MKNITAPLFAKWAQLGIAVEPAYYEYSTYVEARDAAFIEEAIAFNSSKIAGRLVPRYVFAPIRVPFFLVLYDEADTLQRDAGERNPVRPVLHSLQGLLQ